MISVREIGNKNRYCWKSWPVEICIVFMYPENLNVLPATDWRFLLDLSGQLSCRWLYLQVR